MLMDLSGEYSSISAVLRLLYKNTVATVVVAFIGNPC